MYREFWHKNRLFGMKGLAQSLHINILPASPALHTLIIVHTCWWAMAIQPFWSHPHLHNRVIIQLCNFFTYLAIQRKHTFVELIVVWKEEQWNHDFIVHYKMKSRFYYTIFFAHSLIQRKCVLVVHCVKRYL